MCLFFLSLLHARTMGRLCGPFPPFFFLYLSSLSLFPQVKELLEGIAKTRLPVPDFLCDSEHLKLAPAEENAADWEVYHIDPTAVKTVPSWSWDVVPRLQWTFRTLAVDLWVQDNAPQKKKEKDAKSEEPPTWEPRNKQQHKASKSKKRSKPRRGRSRKNRQTHTQVSQSGGGSQVYEAGSLLMDKMGRSPDAVLGAVPIPFQVFCVVLRISCRVATGCGFLHRVCHRFAWKKSKKFKNVKHLELPKPNGMYHAPVITLVSRSSLPFPTWNSRLERHLTISPYFHARPSE